MGRCWNKLAESRFMTGPAGLSAVQLLGSAEVGEVLVVSVDSELLHCPF